MKRILPLLTLAFLCAPLSVSQAQTATSGNQPIEITADDNLKWDREGQIYTATGNAIAKQGDVSVKGDTLKATYNENAQGTTEITSLLAIGTVEITSPPHSAHGDHGIYEPNTGVVTLTGKDLRIVSPDQVITARDKIEYFAQDQKMVASGNATATREENKIESPVMQAFFTKDENGKQQLDRIEAFGGVTITSPTETVVGDQAVYSMKTGRAILTGDVKIQRGQNWLNGKRAELDIETGVSQLFANPDGNQSGGRVTGVFYPDSKDDIENKNEQ